MTSILGNVPGTLAHAVFTERHPRIIAQTRRAHAYPPAIDQRLAELLAEITDGVVRPLPAAAFDAGDWNTRWNHGYLGRLWLDLPWLWGESYFYRRLLDAVGYFEAGPWQGVDPFAPVKAAELAESAIDAELVSFDEWDRRAPDERFRAFVLSALWGNRADLAANMSKPDSAERAAVSTLVVDDISTVWEYVRSRAPLSIAVVADNSGRELIPDLMLTDLLLAERLANSVTLYVKAYPYFVSDATEPDVDAALVRMSAGPGVAASRAAHRLAQARADQRFGIAAPRLFCAPMPYRDDVNELARIVGDHDLTIAKGDLNYRRLVGDEYLPTTIPFVRRVAYFPTPVVALRTLKSEVIVGLADGQQEALDATGDDWRESGRYAMVQARLQST